MTLPLSAISSPVGYGTYSQYLEDLDRNSSHPEYEGLRDTLSYYKSNWRCLGDCQCDFFDLNHDGEVSKYRHSTTNVNSKSKDINNPEIMQIRDSLRKDAQVTARIVVVYCRDSILLPTWVVDMLGLGANIEPSFFQRYYAQAIGGEDYARTKLAEPWRSNSRYLYVKPHWVLLLDEPPLPKTVIVLLEKDMWPANHTGTAKLTKTPSKLLEKTQEDMRNAPHGLQSRSDEITRDADKHIPNDLLDRIAALAPSAGKHGPDAFRFACVEACVELTSSIVPVLPRSVNWDGPFYSGESGGHPQDPQELWRSMREELDDAKNFSRKLTQYSTRHFNIKDTAINDAFMRTQSLYQYYVSQLESEEGRLRDQLSIIASAKGIEMARLSIQESKRVMLLTTLAFFFVPISLATSIFGMNVQEINGTGHMLWVFIVTTVVLLAVAGLLFTIVAVVTNHRRKLIARRETREREGFWGAERSFKEKILLVPLYTK